MYIHVYTLECTYHVRTMYIHVYTFQDMSVPCMYMFVFFNNCMYYVCKLTYDSIVHSLYVHGTDMYVHVYARWSGFQMSRFRSCGFSSSPPDGWQGVDEPDHPGDTSLPSAACLHHCLVQDVITLRSDNSIRYSPGLNQCP